MYPMSHRIGQQTITTQPNAKPSPKTMNLNFRRPLLNGDPVRAEVGYQQHPDASVCLGSPPRSSNKFAANHTNLNTIATTTTHIQRITRGHFSGFMRPVFAESANFVICIPFEGSSPPYGRTSSRTRVYVVKSPT